MASATAAKATRDFLFSPTLAAGGPAPRRPVASVMLNSIGLLSSPLPPQYCSHSRYSEDRYSWKPAYYCRKFGWNVVAMATREPPADVVSEPSAQVPTELPELVKTIQEKWGKLEDKYALASLAFATLIALYGSSGIISAIDSLPLVPGLFEIVGIGYTGWFAYHNLVFKPDREALIAKIKSFYSDVI